MSIFSFIMFVYSCYYGVKSNNLKPSPTLQAIYFIEITYIKRYKKREALISNLPFCVLEKIVF